MKVAFIGAGKVGKAMGMYLSDNSIKVVGYYSKSFSSAEMAASVTKSRAYNSILQLLEDADTIAITTPDDEIANVIDGLKKNNAVVKGKVVFHMSGVHSSDILSVLKDNKENKTTILSLHPLLSFSDSTNSVRDLKRTFFTMEGEGERLEEVKDLLKELGNNFIEISAESKVLYHTGCTVLANYFVTIIDVGLAMLIESGFTKEQASMIAEPLIKNTLENIIRQDTEKALTGPISRGDFGTIEQHISYLKKSGKWLELYKILGTHTIELAKRAGTVNQESVLKLMEVIDDNE
ncbi:MAG: Rossmann-like and DUF2520 domain-containing protein [Vulcanibacillus sp.]